MSAGAAPAAWTRDEAIARLRIRLVEIAGVERSICRVAAERGIFCRGFRRWNDSEFHERCKATLGVSTHLTRAQMERLADIWQLSEQLRHGVGLACDAPAGSHGACRGWEEFSDQEIREFSCEMIAQAQAQAQGEAP